MPTIVIDGYKFRFYSLDGSEPPHVHVLHGENEARVWLQPIAVAHNYGYHHAELNRILKLTRQNQAELLEAWNVYFSR
ncbi:MAG: DUF4160 domain-containing protein [Anaerolineae bacterium]|nr:DUF4160 domain-containing protein [Anaerolineae bacterium]